MGDLAMTDIDELFAAIEVLVIFPCIPPRRRIYFRPWRS